MERDPEGQRIYKVEVQRANGTTVDVNLNGSFDVVAEADDDANEANERDDNEPDDRDDNDADDRNDTDD
jgi:hypothetical protein